MIIWMMCKFINTITVVSIVFSLFSFWFVMPGLRCIICGYRNRFVIREVVVITVDIDHVK